ncbi:hypothetical protein [Sporolactobacillus terrae]|uniref:hypothetical protein n=1 Tax=Sporolactobacillus terrae TaxID=269673 RepID=UPI0021004084|nr:hypothetical protein [Sporolactobacillus terrae]
MDPDQALYLKRASQRQIKKAVTSDFIGSFSSSLFNFAISLYILKLTGSAMNFGTTLLIGPLIGIVFHHLSVTLPIITITSALWFRHKSDVCFY